MSRTHLPIAAIATTLLAVSSIGLAAEDKPMASADKPMPMMEHHQHDVTIVQLVEAAQTRKDHEAVARRFDEQAAQFDKDADHHAKLAKNYHARLGNPKVNTASLAQHCDNLVKNLRTSAAEAREMAKLHREAAQSLPQ
ncbi:MAG: hypothetical protein AB7U95_00500 [Reyranella sp.]